MLALAAMGELAEDACSMLPSVAPWGSPPPSQAVVRVSRSDGRSCSVGLAELMGTCVDWWVATRRDFLCVECGPSREGALFHDLEVETDRKLDLLARLGPWMPYLEKIPRTIVPLCALAPVGALVLGGGPTMLSGVAVVSHGGPLLLISGLSFNTRVLYEIYACILAAGAYSVWTRHPEVETRDVQRQASVALAISATSHLLLSLGFVGHLPIAHSDIALRILPDFLILPLIANSLGFLAGQSTSAMLPSMALSAGSAACFTLAAAAPAPAHAATYAMAGSGCLVAVLYDLGRTLPASAAAVSETSRLRVQAAADIIVCMWGSSAIVYGLGTFNLMPAAFTLQAVTLIDSVGKLGVCHLILRSKQAFKSAADYRGRSGISLGPT